MCGLTFLPHTTSSSPPFCCILIYTLSLFTQLLWSTLCFISSSRRPLSALFLWACSGHSVNRACHFLGPATFLCSLSLSRCAGSGLMQGHPGRTGTVTGSSPLRSLLPEMDSCIRAWVLGYIDQHTWCFIRLFLLSWDSVRTQSNPKLTLYSTYTNIYTLYVVKHLSKGNQDVNLKDWEMINSNVRTSDSWTLGTVLRAVQTQLYRGLKRSLYRLYQTSLILLYYCNNIVFPIINNNNKNNLFWMCKKLIY